jgi:Streptomyces sporulation and cell division protein, SsgA
MDSSTVSAELGVLLVLPDQVVVPLAATIVYSREEPYAVHIAFHVGLDEPIEWIFARDLLSAGSESGGPGSVLNLELSSPFGRAHFEVPARSISDFLRRTYQLVPAGEESEHIDVEAGLNDLLRQAS